MDKAVVWYIRMSLMYFALSGIIGIGMILIPEWRAYYRQIHVHFNLLGWMSMMIYGVGYHILPKFSGKYIYSIPIMNNQFWFSNLGLIGMGIGWVMMARQITPEASRVILVVSSIASLIGMVMFVFNIGMTVQAVQKPAPAGPAKA